MSADDHGQQPGRAPHHCVGYNQSVDDAVAERIFNRSRHRNAGFADGYDDDAFECRQIDALVADYKPCAVPSHAFMRDPFDIDRLNGATKDFERNGSQIGGGL
jgi:hypothetical protein